MGITHYICLLDYENVGFVQECHDKLDIYSAPSLKHITLKYYVTCPLINIYFHSEILLSFNILTPLPTMFQFNDT